MPTISVYDAAVQSSALTKPADTALFADCIARAARMLMQTMPEISADVEKNMLVSYNIGINLHVQKTKTPGVNKVTAGVVYNPKKIKASCTGEVEDPAQQQLKLKAQSES